MSEKDEHALNTRVLQTELMVAAAGSEPCVSEKDEHALNTRVLQTELMVAALSCNEQAATLQRLRHKLPRSLAAQGASLTEARRLHRRRRK